MSKTRQLIPAARKTELVIQEADGETLVYDLKSHKAHCLNKTAALVWKYCDGTHTAARVAQRLEEELGAKVSSEVVWLAVARLENSKLLEESRERPPALTRMSRREMARRLGLATAIALPFIASINAPAAIQAATCAGVEQPCGGVNPPCCAGLICFNGLCARP
jgi:hypothetical protein